MEQNMETLYQHHDLLVELGKVELAMDRLDERPADDRDMLHSILETRQSRLREQLVRLTS